MEHIKEYNLWLEINDWIEEKKHANPNKIEQTFHKTSSYFIRKIPQAYTNGFNNFLSTAFFHTQSLLQTSKQFQEKKLDIIKRAQILKKDVSTINDLRQLPIRQLDFLADQEISKALIISSVQGGISGTNSKLTLVCDLPSLLFINLKTVQEIAMCYGYDVSIPKEMECSLKVLQAALLPNEDKYMAWNSLMGDISKLDDEDVFAKWEHDINIEVYFKTLSLQLSKLILIHSLQKRLIGGIPLLGITIGAKWNENMTKNILQFAKNFYQFRLLSKRIKQEPTV